MCFLIFLSFLFGHGEAIAKDLSLLYSLCYFCVFTSLCSRIYIYFMVFSVQTIYEYLHFLFDCFSFFSFSYYLILIHVIHLFVSFFDTYSEHFFYCAWEALQLWILYSFYINLWSVLFYLYTNTRTFFPNMSIKWLFPMTFI